MIIENIQSLEIPIVSVVVATYNQEKFIEATILSIIEQQTTFLFEIVIADDCSKDQTRAILLTLQEKYPFVIRLLFNDVNLRVTMNYVNAIKNAKGKYIATCDGDDKWIDKYKLQEQYDILNEQSTVSLVHTGYIGFSETGKRLYSVSKWKSEIKKGLYEGALPVLLGHFSSYPLGSSSCFRKEPYLNFVDLYPELISDSNSSGEGTLLLVSMALSGRFYFIDKEMVAYLVQSSSLSHFETKEEQLKFMFRYFGHRSLFIQTLFKDGKHINKLYRSLYIMLLFSIKNNIIKNYISAYNDNIKFVESMHFMHRFILRVGMSRFVTSIIRVLLSIYDSTKK